MEAFEAAMACLVEDPQNLYALQIRAEALRQEGLLDAAMQGCTGGCPQSLCFFFLQERRKNFQKQQKCPVTLQPFLSVCSQYVFLRTFQHNDKIAQKTCVHWHCPIHGPTYTIRVLEANGFLQNLAWICEETCPGAC